tara:strand:+ start:1366 stop:2169 length:804 start_codon:yes stop_codon:yes gene_type:complete
MGFYVNVVAKKSCVKQINTAWKKRFDGFLIYTKEIIKSEIDYIHNNKDCKHLRYIKTIEDWNDTFSILKEYSGQVFLRAYGYDEERQKEFQKEQTVLKEQIKFLLEHRFLFEKITGLQDAVSVFPDLEIDYDYIENGRNKNYFNPTFDKLPQPHQSKVFKRCLELNNPELWYNFLQLKENPNDFNLFDNLAHTIINRDKGLGETILQRVELIQRVVEGLSENLSTISYYMKNKKVPTLFEIRKVISLNQEEFDEYINSLRNSNKKSA